MVAEMQRMPNEMNSLWRVYVSDDNGQAPSLNHGTCNKCIWWIGSALLASSLMMLLKFDSTNFRKNWSAPDSRHPLDWDLPCKSRLVKNVRKVWNPLTSTTHLTSSPIRIYTILNCIILYLFLTYYITLYYIMSYFTILHCMFKSDDIIWLYYIKKCITFFITLYHFILYWSLLYIIYYVYIYMYHVYILIIKYHKSYINTYNVLSIKY